MWKTSCGGTVSEKRGEAKERVSSGIGTNGNGVIYERRGLGVFT